MTYLSVEEYHVRFEHEGQRLDGKMWLRPAQEWEVEVSEDRPRVRATPVPEGDMTPRALFCRVVEALEPQAVRLRSCGTCAHFRPSPLEGGSGWQGHCAFRGDSAEAPPFPGEVALLAPDCHAFAYQGTEQAVADATDLPAHARSFDPEETRSLPTAARPSDEERGVMGRIRGMLGLKKREQEAVRAGVVERPGGQPCPSCGTRMTNRASVANADERGEERVLSVWRCPHCNGNFLDDWFEAYVGSRARDAERLYVVPPVEANEAAAIVVHCPRPDVKGCTCIANQHFDRWGNGLTKHGRRIRHRESVVSL